MKHIKAQIESLEKSILQYELQLATNELPEETVYMRIESCEGKIRELKQKLENLEVLATQN